MRTARSAIAMGCVFLFIGIAVALFRHGDSLDCRDDPDWDAWRETSATDSAIDADEGEDRRRDAAGEIRHCRSLQGRSRREVRRLLGAPGKTSPAVRGDHTFHSYYLGPDWLGLDSQWFGVEFDGRGRVVRLHIN